MSAFQTSHYRAPQVDDASPIVEYSGEWSTTPPEGASSLFQYHVRAIIVFLTSSDSPHFGPIGWNGSFNDRECTVSLGTIDSGLKRWIVLSFNNLSWNLSHNLRDKISTGSGSRHNTRRCSAACKRICGVYTIPTVSLQHFKPAFQPSYPSRCAGRHWREGICVGLFRVDNRTQ